MVFLSIECLIILTPRAPQETYTLFRTGIKSENGRGGFHRDRRRNHIDFR
jgi:hypothetical protein